MIKTTNDFEGVNMNEPIGNCEICNAEVSRDSHYEWCFSQLKDATILTLEKVQAMRETAELLAMGFEVSE